MISVIVPVFQAERYLPACIASLTAQTFQKTEIILVDDGSTDGSPALCDAYARSYRQVRVIHQQNGGVSRARNAGIQAAAGDFLAFVDADDWVEPFFLAHLREAFDDNVDMALCAMEDDQGLALKRETIPVARLQIQPSRYLFHVYTSFVSNKLFRSSIIRENHLQFTPGMGRGEDACFTMGYLSHSRMISVVPEVGYHYRRHSGSAMHHFSESACRDECALLQTQYEFFHRHALGAEETAYRLWEYGKTLSVLRAAASGTGGEFAGYVRILQSQPRYAWSIQNPPDEAGKKGKLAAHLWKKGRLSLLRQLLRTM